MSIGGNFKNLGVGNFAPPQPQCRGTRTQAKIGLKRNWFSDDFRGNRRQSTQVHLLEGKFGGDPFGYSAATLYKHNYTKRIRIQQKQ